MLQAVVRYAKEELHLTAQLRLVNGPVKRFVRLCCAIPLLPQRWFIRGLGIIMREARQEGNRTYRLLRPFFDYFMRNWVAHRQRRGLMSVYGSIHRTNNSCESHHRQLNKYIQVPHPNVYDFIGKFGSPNVAMVPLVSILQQIISFWYRYIFWCNLIVRSYPYLESKCIGICVCD